MPATRRKQIEVVDLAGRPRWDASVWCCFRFGSEREGGRRSRPCERRGAITSSCEGRVPELL